MATLAHQQKPVANVAPQTAPQLRAVAREEVSENDGRTLARGGATLAAPSPRSGNSPSSFGHSIAQLPSLSPTPLSIQPKLKINQPGDEYEQEADRVADMVMRMPDPTVQRKCSCGGGNCSKCKGGHADCEHELLQMKRVDANSLGPEEAPALVHETLRQSGQPLDPAVRSYMEGRFGHDFANVRVHVGEGASASAEAMDAQAYTVGQHVVFGAGQHSPGTANGRELVAHELTHVVQQRSEGEKSVQRAPKGSTKSRVTADLEKIAAARQQAVLRLSVAYLRINGTSPNFDARHELTTVKGLVSPRIQNLEQVADILRQMMSIVRSGPIEIGPEIDACSQWRGYVVGNHVPIHLCRSWFTNSDEDAIRTLIHEAAHAVGFGQPGAESYFPIFDCGFSTDDNWNSADAWARYVHCISGATPDEPEVVR